jgi:glucokinase
VHRCVNLGWDEFNVNEKLGELVGMPVMAGNDANVAALGEMWKGGGQGHNDLVVVTLGTGVGGGIIINGKMLTGANGSGGEIGHIHVQDGEPDTCGCGNNGCLEQYASATGIVRMANKKLSKTDDATTLRNFEPLTAKDIFDEAKAGDEVAKELVDELGRILGGALSNLACVVNPQSIVIGGGVSKAGAILIETVQEHFKENAFHAFKETEFGIATLGNDAGIYGAAKLVIDEK